MSRPRKPGGRMAWMAFYVDDFLSATTHLDRAALGSYVLLLLAYWRNRGPLDANDDLLRGMARCSPRDWARDKAILSRFFDLETCPGRWVQLRVEIELQVASGQIMAAIESAKASNESQRGRGTNASRSRTRTRRERVTTGAANGALSHPSPSSSAFASEEPAGAAGGFGQEFPYRSPEFLDAWARWVAFRSARKTPLTEHSVKQQFKDFAKWGESGSISAIEQSIRSDWQGVFQPSGDKQAGAAPPVQFPERRNAAAEFMARQRTEREAEAQAEASKDIA